MWMCVGGVISGGPQRLICFNLHTMRRSVLNLRFWQYFSVPHITTSKSLTEQIYYDTILNLRYNECVLIYLYASFIINFLIHTWSEQYATNFPINSLSSPVLWFSFRNASILFRAANNATKVASLAVPYYYNINRIFIFIIHRRVVGILASIAGTQPNC